MRHFLLANEWRPLSCHSEDPKSSIQYPVSRIHLVQSFEHNRKFASKASRESLQYTLHIRTHYTYPPTLFGSSINSVLFHLQLLRNTVNGICVCMRVPYSLFDKYSACKRNARLEFRSGVWEGARRFNLVMEVVICGIDLWSNLSSVAHLYEINRLFRFFVLMNKSMFHENL